MIKRLLEKIIRIYSGSFFAISPDNCEKGKITGFEFKKVEKALFYSDPIFAEKRRKERFIKRVPEGHVCYGFFDKGRVVSYIWLTDSVDKKSSAPWLYRLRANIPVDTVYIWDCFTSPGYRKRGLYKNALQNAAFMWKDRNIATIYIYAANNNNSSISGICSAGFRKVFYLSALKLGNLYFLKKERAPLKITLCNSNFSVIDDSGRK